MLVIVRDEDRYHLKSLKTVSGHVCLKVLPSWNNSNDLISVKTKYCDKILS